MGVWLRRAPPAQRPGARDGPTRRPCHRVWFHPAIRSPALPVRAHQCKFLACVGKRLTVATHPSSLIPRHALTPTPNLEFRNVGRRCARSPRALDANRFSPRLFTKMRYQLHPPRSRPSGRARARIFAITHPGSPAVTPSSSHDLVLKKRYELRCSNS